MGRPSLDMTSIMLYLATVQRGVNFFPGLSCLKETVAGWKAIPCGNGSDIAEILSPRDQNAVEEVPPIPATILNNRTNFIWYNLRE